MKKKDRVLIKRYQKLRGADNPDLKLDILLDIYQKANKEDRAKFRLEAQTYIKAVEDETITAGMPLGRPELPPLN